MQVLRRMTKTFWLTFFLDTVYNTNE